MKAYQLRNKFNAGLSLVGQERSELQWIGTEVQFRYA